MTERFCPRCGFDLAQGQEMKPGVMATCPCCYTLLVSRGLPWMERTEALQVPPNVMKHHSEFVRQATIAKQQRRRAH